MSINRLCLRLRPLNISQTLSCEPVGILEWWRPALQAQHTTPANLPLPRTHKYLRPSLAKHSQTRSMGEFFSRDIGAGSIYGVKSVGSFTETSSSEVTEYSSLGAIKQNSSSSWFKLSSAYSRSGAGINPTRIPSLTTGSPPSSWPAACSIFNFTRKSLAATRDDPDMSMTFSGIQRGVISASRAENTGFDLVSRYGYEFKSVKRS